MRNFRQISKRTLAYIILKISGTLGGGFIMGIEVIQAIVMAAFIGLMEVSEEVSRAYVQDGDISETDLNAIFGDLSTDHQDHDPEA